MPKPNTVVKETADKFTHLSDQEPERDGLDYGPEDSFTEIVTSVPPDDTGAGEGKGVDGGDNLEDNYSSTGKGDDTMDMGGENFSQDIIQRTEKKPDADPDKKPDESAADAEKPKPDEDGADPDKKPDPVKAKADSPAAKRISKVIQERNQAREQAAYYRGLAEGKPAEDGADPPAAIPTEKPKLEDYESYDDFSEAMADFKIGERDRSRADDAEGQAQAKTKELISTQIDAGIAKYDDFEKVVMENKALPFNEAVIEAISETEAAADVMYELAKNPDQLIALSRMSPVAMGRELAKIEGRIAGGAESKLVVKKASSAPAPITPVNTGAEVVSRKDPADMSMKEFIHWRTRGGKRKV